MELFATGVTNYASASRTFRHNILGDLVMALLFGLCLPGMGYGLVEISQVLHPSLWIVVGPVAALTGLLLAMVASTAFRSFLAGLKQSNWHARVGPNGLHLNLRSYRNAHFGGDDPTVVFFTFGEIAQVARVNETLLEERGDRKTQTRSAWIELELAGVDTAALTVAVAAERNREAPTEEGIVGSSRTKHHHIPVLCPAPGRVQVEWHRGLFRALSNRVAVAPTRAIDLTTELAQMEVGDRAVELAKRGQRIAAIRLLRKERGLDNEAARSWLAEHVS